MALILWTIGLVLVVSATAQQFYANTRYGKRDDIPDTVDKPAYGNARPGRSDAKVDVAVRNDRFFLGSRYGKRSNEIRSSEQNNGRKWGEFTLGNDGFFFGSRYGKRSQNTPTDDQVIFSEPEEDIKHLPAMNCAYTGVGALFTCFPKTTAKDVKTSELL